MHPNVTKQQFIELRAQGLSLSRIADQLSVSKRTLVDWNREHQAEIDSLRALELEALHEKLLASHEQQLTHLAQYQRKIDEELAKRPLETLTTDKLLRLSLLLRREIRDVCTLAATKVPHSSVVPSAPEDHPPQSQIKVDQASTISPGASAPHEEDRNAAFRRQHMVSTTEHQPLESQIKADQAQTIVPAIVADPVCAPPEPIPLPSITLSTPQEHCLHCGDPLPPLLSDGSRPSLWCAACRGCIAAAPGLSIRELCPACNAPIPVHGYNIKRWLGACPQCRTNLPDLDVNAPLKWLPPQHPLQFTKTEEGHLAA